MRISMFFLLLIQFSGIALAQAPTAADSLKDVLAELEHQQKVISKQIEEVKAQLAAVQSPEPKPKFDFCATFVKEETDRMTGKTTIVAPQVPIVITKSATKEKMTISWVMFPALDALVLMLLVEGGGACLDKGAEINMLFADGSRQAFLSRSEFNCNGRAHIGFEHGYGKKYLDILGLKQLSAIRVTTANGYVEVDIPKAVAEEFMKSTQCIQERFGD
jgi:hypothetical protein